MYKKLLSEYLKCNEDNLIESPTKYFNLPTYTYNESEYAIGNDKMCDSASVDSICLYIESHLLTDERIPLSEFEENLEKLNYISKKDRGFLLGFVDGIEIKYKDVFIYQVS